VYIELRITKRFKSKELIFIFNYAWVVLIFTAFQLMYT
jgi:hypothetical protein